MKFLLFPRRWYFRKIKRIEAEKKLLLPENEHGAFLIRDSESRHNDYSLSGESRATTVDMGRGLMSKLLFQ
jgi:SH2 domain